MVGSLPAGAGDAGSGPDLGGSRMPRSGWARDPRLLGLRCASGACAPQRERPRWWGPAHRGEEWPPLAAAGEGPRTETRTQHSHK